MTVADESVKTLPDGFRYTDWGAIEYRVARKEDEDERWEWLCSPLEILAETRNADEKDWGLLVRVKARGGAGIWHKQIVKQSLCVAEGGELFALLASLGLKIRPAKGGKDRLRALQIRVPRFDSGRGLHSLPVKSALFGKLQTDKADTAGAQIGAQRWCPVRHTPKIAIFVCTCRRPRMAVDCLRLRLAQAA